MVKMSRKIPEGIRNIQGSFSHELISLWDNRGLEGKCFWVEDDNGQPISYILVEERKFEKTIRGFYTIQEVRGKGIGSNLLKHVCVFYENANRGPVIVNITKGAEGVYIRNGFTIMGQRKDLPDQSIAYKGVLSSNQEQTLKSKCIFQKTFKL